MADCRHPVLHDDPKQPGVNIYLCARCSAEFKVNEFEVRKPAHKVGDRVRVALGVDTLIPLEGWTVCGLPTRVWPQYKLKHDNGGEMSISLDYVVAL